MNSALDDYINEYISIPNFDLTNHLNQQFFFQEGGFARFFPVLPGGYQPIQAPIQQAPKLDQHELWASVANTITQAGAQINQKRQFNKTFELQQQKFEQDKQQNEINTQLAMANLDLSKQRLTQDQQQFDINKTFKQIELMNTISDKLLNLDLPIYRQEELKAAVTPVAEAMSSLNTADGGESLTNVSKQIGIAYGKLAPYIQEEAHNKQQLKEMELAAQLFPKLYDDPKYGNAGKLLMEKLNGQPPSETLHLNYDLLQQDQQILRDQQTKIQDAQVKHLEMQAKEDDANAFLLSIKGEQGKAIYEGMMEELKGVTDPSKKADIIQKWNAKTSGNQSINNIPGFIEKYHDDPAMMAMLEKFVILEHTQKSVSSSTGQTAGNDFTSDILKLAPNVGHNGFLDSKNQGILADTFKGGDYSLNGPKTSETGGGEITTKDNLTYIPTEIRINDDGLTTTVTGFVKTKSVDVAKELMKDPVKNSDGYYYINDVLVTEPNTRLNIDLNRAASVPGSPLSAPGSSSGTVSTVASTPSDVPSNVSFKGGLSSKYVTKDTLNALGDIRNPDGSAIPLTITDTHQNRDTPNYNNVDIGLGASLNENKKAYEFLQDEDTGLEWAIMHGKEIHFETPDAKQAFNATFPKEDATTSGYWHPAMMTKYNSDGSAPHLHIQTYQKQPIITPNGDVFVTFNPTTQLYDVYDNMGNEGDKLTSFSKADYLDNLKNGTFVPH